MSYRCNDCGKTPFEASSRGDVCVDCMELRGELMRAVNSGLVAPSDFRAIQAAMIGRSHRAANLMHIALGHDPASIPTDEATSSDDDECPSAGNYWD